MAFFDDQEFMISHIRHCFVTSDDTGMCEMVIVNEEAENDKITSKRRLGSKSDPSKTRDPFEFPSVPQSFDISVSPMSTPAQKPNPSHNTGKTRSSELEPVNIMWKDPQQEIPSDEFDSIFKKRPFKKDATPSKSSSKLSNLLKETLRKPNNPYVDYARFDGEAYQGSSTCPTKKLRIFLTMVNEDDRSFPMFVTVLGSATVQELTGLIMFKYTAENLDPPLHGTTDHYCLQIAEDDGEVDTDFPALDKDVLITKFGFTCLALVQVGPKPAPAKPPAVNFTSSNSGVIVKVNEPRRGYAQVKVDSTKVKLKVVYDKMLKKRNLKRTAHEYVLEKASEPGVALDLEAPLSTMGTLEFVLTRGDRGKLNPVEKDVKFDFTSFQYKSYKVQMLHKLRTVTEIQLGISMERIEIDPLSVAKSTKLWLVKQKPVSYDMENIADCEITETKSTGRLAFRIWYFSQNSHEFKHHDFEADAQVTDEIVKKVHHIFKSTVSEKRREFLAAKERKAEKRKSIR